MEILIKRIAKRETYTIGKMYINNKYVCDTLEDTDRGLAQSMSVTEIASKKIKHRTAIPTGTYTITVNVKSNRYSKSKWYVDFCNAMMPRFINVPGYDGILIHPGNTDKNTSGCILVGKNTIVGKLTESRATFKKLYPMLKDAANKGEKISVTIQ